MCPVHPREAAKMQRLIAQIKYENERTRQREVAQDVIQELLKAVELEPPQPCEQKLYLSERQFQFYKKNSPHLLEGYNIVIVPLMEVTNGNQKENL